MYIIQATVAGNFSFNLEKGSMTLMPGQRMNIENHCSREWIEHDPEFNDLKQRGVIHVVFDNVNDKVPDIDFKSISAKVAEIPPFQAPSREPVSVQPPVATYLPPLPEPISEEEPIVIDLKLGTTSELKKELTPAFPPTNLMPEKIYTEADMKKMWLGDLKELATKLGLTVPPPASKKKLIKAILDRYSM